MTVEFHQRRRQQFITENYYKALSRHFATSRGYWSSHVPEADSPEQAASLAAASIADDEFKLLCIRYTAGEPIEQLRALLTRTIEAYEAYQVALERHEQIAEVAPLGMGSLGDYERCLQLIGLCYLLHRTDLIHRIARLEDPGYFGADAVYEDLLRYSVPNRADTDVLLHLKVYDALLGAMYGETQEECQLALRDYLQEWYPAFKHVPWHDGHLRIDGTEGDYFGYWAFEAGAVTLLCDIDDSVISHMVYPKDLVAWARDHRHLSEPSALPEGTTRSLRCEANQPCPLEGWWFTPASLNSRRHFKHGEVMPEVDSDYGVAIWQWDQERNSPGTSA